MSATPVSSPAAIRVDLGAILISLELSKLTEWENAGSSVCLGIHWQMDANDETQLGEQIADAVYQRALGR